MSLGRYSKFAVALGGFLGAASQVLADGAVSSQDIGVLAASLSAAILVLVVPNAKASEGVPPSA